MTIKLKLQILTLALLTAGSAQAAEISLLPADAGDVQAQRISAPPPVTLANSAREPVNFAWAIGDAGNTGADRQTYTAQSRHYRVQATAERLAAGVALATTAAGAIVRLHPLDGRGRAPALDDLEIVTDNRVLRGAAGIDRLADTDALRNTALGTQPQTVAFRLREELGAGVFTLRATSGLSADTTYAVNVFDRNSTVVLSARAERDAWFTGDTLRADFAFNGNVHDAGLQAFLLAPDGARRPVAVRALGDGRFRASAPVEYAGAPGQLWEIHAVASARMGDLLVPRSVKTAFAVTHAAARFGGAASVDTADDIRIRLPVDAAADGRYEARGILFGSDAEGRLRPIAAVSSARWIATGTAAIEMSVAASLIDASGLASPFELRDLRLLDQSRMGVLHRQARGLRFD